MADQPKKLSEYNVANTVGVNDRFVVLVDANTSTPNVKTISVNNMILTLLAGAPTYADQATANAAGLEVGSVYQTANGELRIVV